MRKELWKAAEEAVGLSKLRGGSGQSAADRAARSRARMAQARSLCNLFREYLYYSISMNLFGLAAKTPFTRVYEEKSGQLGNSPALFSGELMTHLLIKEEMFGYAVTFDSKPLQRQIGGLFKGDKPPQSAIEFVRFMERGSRRVLTTKQRQMMAIFAKKNDIERDTRKPQNPGYIRPRPFFSRAAERFCVRYKNWNRLRLTYSNLVLYIQIPPEEFSPVRNRG